MKNFTMRRIFKYLLVSFLIMLVSTTLMFAATSCSSEEVEVVSTELTIEPVEDFYGYETGYYKPYLIVVVKNNTSTTATVYVSAQFKYPDGSVCEGEANFGKTIAAKAEAQFIVVGPYKSSKPYGFRAGKPILRVTFED